MTAKLAPLEIVTASVAGLGYELVDFEHSARGLMRVFIDKPDGIGVEDCAVVSNHLTRVFVVENIEFERLEVSSPGLDRPLKSLANFRQYIGCGVKVRLNMLVDGRKRFDGIVESVDGETIVFVVTEEAAGTKSANHSKKSGTQRRVGAEETKKRIHVPFSSIDKTRLIPDI